MFVSVYVYLHVCSHVCMGKSYRYMSACVSFCVCVLVSVSVGVYQQHPAALAEPGRSWFHSGTVKRQESPGLSMACIYILPAWDTLYPSAIHHLRLPPPPTITQLFPNSPYHRTLLHTHNTIPIIGPLIMPQCSHLLANTPSHTHRHTFVLFESSMQIQGPPLND